MGTRNLTCVVKDGKYCVARYGQWDGYPDGQGAIVCDFIMANLQNEDSLALFELRIESLVEISEADLKALWVSVGANPHNNLVGMDVCDRFNEKWPWLNRDCGANILQHIMDRPGLQISLDIEFASASLFCEWVWLLNLDDKTLEVFRGFNKEPLSEGERFKNLEELPRKDDDEYYPVKLWQKIQFDKITNKTIEELNALRTKEYEEAEAMSNNTTGLIEKANQRFIRVSYEESPNGGSFMGTINCSYKTIVAAFGEPSDSDGHKVSSEWYIKDTVTGTYFSLYDYKETNLYDSDNPTVLEFRAQESYDWHIGCSRKIDEDALKEFLDMYKDKPAPITATEEPAEPTNVVYKYKIDIYVTNNYIEMPEGAKILHVYGDMLWALVDTSKPTVNRRIVSAATGVLIADDELGEHIGSVSSGGRVYHLFDCGAPGKLQLC